MIAAGHASDAAVSFDPLRPKLTRVAYRMLGSVADAEDVVQDAFIRWMGADRAAVIAPEAFLRRTVTRLCLDQLKSARHRRETYIGPWLPEPIVDEEEVDDVTLPLMLALERLSPLERAAFLLHDVFGESFDDVAATIGRDAAACRQLAARARAHVREARPRYKVDKQRGLEIVGAFFDAMRSGDMAALGSLLANDISIHSDGGGKRPAAVRPVHGIRTALRLFKALSVLARKYPARSGRLAFIDGLPGVVAEEMDGFLSTTAFEIEDGKIVAIYTMRNPDKLRHLH
jgi:RNA polymerase sigma-70 factor (ECF subfamily)